MNAEHDLVDEIPYDMANLIVPNGKLAPNLVKRGIQMDRDYRASVDMALFNMEHPLVGGYTPDKVALAPRDRACLRDAERNPARAQGSVDSIAVAGVASDLRLRPGIQERNGRVQPGARQGACSMLSDTSIATATAGAKLPDGRPLTLEMATQPDQLSRQLDEIWRKSMSAVNLNIDSSPPSGPRT